MCTGLFCCFELQAVVCASGLLPDRDFVFLTDGSELWAFSEVAFLEEKKKKKKSILFISPDFLEMGSRLVLARISAMLCKQRYFARSCMCLLISSLKPVFWCQWPHLEKNLCSRKTPPREGGRDPWVKQTDRETGMPMHQPLHEKVSVSMLKPHRGQLLWVRIALTDRQSLPCQGWGGRGTYWEEHAVKRALCAAPSVL